MRKLFTTSSVFCFLGLISGCSGSGFGESCTEIGCVDGLQIELAPGEGWPAGHYVFSIEADGAMQTCSGDVPLPPCQNGPSLSCQGASLVTIGESGCALAPSAHGFASIGFQSMPMQVIVRVEHDSMVVADQTLSPTYVTSQPNGPNCPPICRNASEQVAVTF